MQRPQHALAVTLHLRPYRETSVLLDLWLREGGRQAAVARGVRVAGKARRQAELGPLSLNLVELAGSGNVLALRAHDTQRQFPLATPTALRAALYVNELLLRLLPEHDPHPVLFDRYVALLASWAETGAPPVPALACSLRGFEVAVLEELGYGLVFDETIDGEPVTPDGIYQVDPEQGVVPARRGLDWPQVRGDALLALAHGTEGPELAGKPLRDLMRTILRHRLGGRMLRAWQG